MLSKVYLYYRCFFLLVFIITTVSEKAQKKMLVFKAKEKRFKKFVLRYKRKIVHFHCTKSHATVQRLLKKLTASARAARA